MSAGKLRLKDSATGNIVTIAANYDVGDSEDRVILLPTEPGVLATDVDLDNAVVNLNAAVAGSSSRVVTPIIISPLTGTEDFSGIITTSPFALKEGYESTHVSTDWEIAKDLNFTDIAVSSYNDTNNKTSFTFNPEESNTTYYIRVRHNSSAYVSKWSNPISVSSVNVYISSPEVTVDGDDLNTSLKPSFSSSPFTVINGTDTHTSTDWEISLNNDFTNIIFSNYDSNTNKLTMSLISNLLYGTEYFIRARYKGAKYTSAWSNIATFRTSNKTDTPVLSGVSNIEEGKPVTINIMNYNSNLTYRVSTTLGSVSRNGAVLTLNTPNVTSNVIVIVSVVAVDSMNQAGDSDPATHNVTVINIPTVADQALFYNATNIKSSFTKTTMDTSSGSLKPNHNMNILDSKNTSSVNKIYINNQLTDVEVGETLTAGSGEVFTVSTVNDDGTIATITGVKTISCGYNNTVIVKEDGTLWATGNNGNGQLGLNDTTDRLVYTQVPNITNPKMISCGAYHTVIVKEDGTLWATGYNGNGQLGLNDTTNRLVYTATGIVVKQQVDITYKPNYWVVPSTPLSAVPTYVTVSAHKASSLPIEQDTIDTDFKGLTTVSYKETVKNVLDSKNTSTTSRVYINNLLTDVSIGDHLVGGNGELFEVAVVNDDGTSITMDGVKTVIRGGQHFCIIKDDGYLYTAGMNNYGQLGLGDKASRYSFTKVPNILNPKLVVCGLHHTIVVMFDGTLWATGYNIYGQLGLNDKVDRTTFVQVPNITDVKDVKCGVYNTFIIKEDNSVLAAGYNQSGSLGLNDIVDRQVFTPIPDLNNFKMLSIADFHLVMVKQDGSTWVCGGNNHGGLGLGDTTNRLVLTQLVGITNPKQILCSGTSTFIVKSDDTLWACGYNGSGGLGLGNNTNKNVLTQIATEFNNPKVLLAGQYHAVIIKQDGTMWVTGSSQYGQLGLGNTTDKNVFTQVPGISNPKDIVVGQYHTAIVKDDNLIWACGYNAFGQLGLGDTTNRTSLTNTNIKPKAVTPIIYKPNYYVEPIQPLSAPVTSVYNVSKVKFNDVEAIPTACVISNQVSTVTCQDVEFEPSRTLVTEAIVSKQNVLTEIVGSVTKLA